MTSRTGRTGRAQVLVDARTLAAELDSAAAPVLLDVRWELGDPAGRAHYESAHLPGAVFVDLDAELSGPPTREGGRHPLPRIEDLQAAARRWGLRNGSPVVAYDNTGGRAAARAWWLLRWAGHRDVRLLDGGLGAWLAAGLASETGPITPNPGDVVLADVGLGAGAQPTVDADEAERWPASGVLLDARPAERYRGEVEPLDSRPGHIPGAVSAPTSGNLAAGRHLPSAPPNSPAITATSVSTRTRPSPSTAAPGSPRPMTSRRWPRSGSMRRCTRDRGRPGRPTRIVAPRPARNRAEPRSSQGRSARRGRSARGGDAGANLGL